MILNKKTKILIAIFIIVMIFIFSTNVCYCMENLLNEEQYILNNSIDENTINLIYKYEIISKSKNINYHNIMILLKDKITEYYNNISSYIIFLLVIILLSCIVKSMFSDEKTRLLINTIIVISTISYLIKPIIELLKSHLQTIINFDYFSKTFIPIFAGSLATCGYKITGIGINITLFIITNISMELIINFFIPFMYIYISFSIIGAIDTTMKINTLVKNMHNFIIWLIGLTLIIYLGIITIKTNIMSIEDGIASKSTKFMISTFIPGVGSVLSDLYYASRGFFSIIKGFIGIYGSIVTCVIFLPNIINTILWYLIMSIVSHIALALENYEFQKLCKNFASSFSLLLIINLYLLFLFIISVSLIILVSKG